MSDASLFARRDKRESDRRARRDQACASCRWRTPLLKVPTVPHFGQLTREIFPRLVRDAITWPRSSPHLTQSFSTRSPTTNAGFSAMSSTVTVLLYPRLCFTCIIDYPTCNDRLFDPGQIIRRHFDAYAVAYQDSNAVFPHLAGNDCQYHVRRCFQAGL